jgi:hypothetical protein
MGRRTKIHEIVVYPPWQILLRTKVQTRATTILTSKLERLMVEMNTERMLRAERRR